MNFAFIWRLSPKSTDQLFAIESIELQAAIWQLRSLLCFKWIERKNWGIHSWKNWSCLTSHQSIVLRGMCSLPHRTLSLGTAEPLLQTTNQNSSSFQSSFLSIYHYIPALVTPLYSDSLKYIFATLCDSELIVPLSTSSGSPTVLGLRQSPPWH